MRSVVRWRAHDMELEGGREALGHVQSVNVFTVLVRAHWHCANNIFTLFRVVAVGKKSSHSSYDLTGGGSYRFSSRYELGGLSDISGKTRRLQ